MFAQANGPTALRPELIFALSLSLDEAELSLPAGDGPYCAALAAAWNGKKGTVAVLLRHLKEPIVIRHVFNGRLASEEAVNSAVDEGIAFAESLGFAMDHPAFRDIGARQQKQRLGAWNDLRRTKKRVRHLSARASKKDKASEPAPPVVEPEPLAPEPEATARRPACRGAAGRTASAPDWRRTVGRRGPSSRSRAPGPTRRAPARRLSRAAGS